MRFALISLVLVGLVLAILSVDRDSKTNPAQTGKPAFTKRPIEPRTPPASAPADNVNYEIEELAQTKEPPDIRLIGIIYRNESRYALLQIKKTTMQLQLGDYVDKYWQIADIKSNRIKLRFATQTATFRLQNSNDNLQEAPVADNNPVRLAALKRMESAEFRRKIHAYLRGRRPVEVAYPMGVEFSGVDKYDDTHYGVNRKAITDSIDQQQLYRHIKMSFEQEQVKITEIVPGSLFDKGGLQVGDRLERINGKPVNKPSEVAQLYPALYSQGSIEIELTREGEGISLQYTLDEGEDGDR